MNALQPTPMLRNALLLDGLLSGVTGLLLVLAAGWLGAFLELPRLLLLVAGSALLLANEPRIITCSLHCEKNFPYRKQHSDWDIAVAKDCSDEAYLNAVEQSLLSLLNWHQPDLVIYDAGVDIHQQDELGLLNISTPALYQRDLTVLQSCTERNIPVAAVIGGGYQRNVAALVQLHLQLFKAAFSLYGSEFASKIET